MNSLPFTPGDRIKYSCYRLRPARDWYLSRGRPSERSEAKQELERLQAVRGTVLACGRNRFGCLCVEYRLDDGGEGSAAFDQFEKA